MNPRLKYALLWLLTIILGLLSRRYRHAMPGFLDEYLGDTIWAGMLYYGARMLFVRRSRAFALALSLGFAYAVEISCLYKTPWLSHIRYTTLGRLVLGTDFVWSDFPCYTAGVLLAWLSDYPFKRQARVIG